MKAQLSLDDLLGCGVEAAIAPTLLDKINTSLATLPAVECWQRLSQHVLQPGDPFALHELLYATVYADWDPQQGPSPAWVPTPEQIDSTHIADWMKKLQLTSYTNLHTWSVQHRAEYWAELVQRLGIRFRQPYRAIVDLSRGVESPEWLVGAQLNIVESCFQANPDAAAIVFQPEGGVLQTVSYGELNALVNRVSNGFVNAGFQRGDAIAIILPMTIEAVALYLGIIQAGGVVVSVADSFAATEMATRLRIAGATGVFTQDVIRRGGRCLPLYDRVVEAGSPRAIVLGESIPLRSGDLTWSAFLSPNDSFEPLPLPPAAPSNILFSSGTTGDPKAIPWSHTTPIKCAADAHLHHDIRPGERVAWPTNLGWMMGPWLIYASLINRATIALYGGAPGDRGFGQFIQDAGVTVLGVVPSLVNTWRTTGCMEGLDWQTIKAFSSTGECSNPQDMLYLMALGGYKPIIEYCGGTEIGGAYITGTLVQPASPSTFSTPALGLDLVLLADDEQPAEEGEAFLIPPSIGLSTELLNRDHHEVYFAHTPSHSGTTLRRHGDRLERLPNGYYRAQGRVDDTMNLRGIKVSAVEIERVLNTVMGVDEVAAIAVSPPDGGPSQLVVYAIASPGTQPSSETLLHPLQTALRHHLSPLFKIHDLVLVDSLPRTASQKLMRRLLRDRYCNQEEG